MTHRVEWENVQSNKILFAFFKEVWLDWSRSNGLENFISKINVLDKFSTNFWWQLFVFNFSSNP